MEIPTDFVEKTRFVKSIFTDIEKEYDVLLRMMTLSFDIVWRKRMLSRMTFDGEYVRILDLACGTGLVTFELSRRVKSKCLLVGLDLSPAMLRIARQKKEKLPAKYQLDFVRAAAENLPFRDKTFSYVTVGLALRNFGNKLEVFKESLRVLINVGRFLSVDFVRPRDHLFWRIYRFHIYRVLPTLGRLVSRHWNRTLSYLAESISIGIEAKEISGLLREVGFRSVFTEEMTLGTVALVSAQK